MYEAAEVTTEASQIWFSIYVFIVTVFCCELFVGVVIGGYSEVSSISSPRMAAVLAPVYEEGNLSKRAALVHQLLRLARKIRPCHELDATILANIQRFAHESLPPKTIKDTVLTGLTPVMSVLRVWPTSSNAEPTPSQSVLSPSRRTSSNSWTEGFPGFQENLRQSASLEADAMSEMPEQQHHWVPTMGTTLVLNQNGHQRQ